MAAGAGEDMRHLRERPGDPVVGAARLGPEGERPDPAFGGLHVQPAGAAQILVAADLPAQQQAELGGMVALGSPVISATIVPEGLLIRTGDAEILARRVVNAAGHFAPKFLHALAGFPAAHIPRQWYAKGNYFSLAGRQPRRSARSIKARTRRGVMGAASL